MMIMAICIVKGMRLQKPSPKYCVRSLAGTPAIRPATKTITSPPNAKTKASGNHFCDQSASAMPSRAKIPTESLLRTAVCSGMETGGPLIISFRVRCLNLRRHQTVSAGTSLLTSGAVSSDFTKAMMDSAFAEGHLAYSAQPLNLSATSS